MEPLYDSELEGLDAMDAEDDWSCDSSDEEREPVWLHSSFIWQSHVDQLLHEDLFQKEYRMSLEAFETLRGHLWVKLKRRTNRNSLIREITVDMIIGTGLRYLAGGKLNDIRHIFKTSQAEAYNSVNCFIAAVLTTSALAIRLPSTPEEWDMINKGFAEKSSNNVMSGCVGALDGYLQKINAPWCSEVANQRAYYSGHYESMGLNCQAACDIRLKFLFFGVIAPGQTNDNAAFPFCTELIKAIKNLPPGMYFVGDAAYSLEEGLLVPYVGSQRLNPDNDAFNFHLSQMRIRIEMAFGRLVRKFQVLKKNLEGKLGKMSQILNACARLHNFIIDCDVPRNVHNDGDDEHVVAMESAPCGMAYLPCMFEPGEEFVKQDGVSQTRVAIVEEIRRQGIRRPEYNLLRKEQDVLHSSENTGMPSITLEHYHVT